LSPTEIETAAQASQPFSRFEFLLAARYLRARRKDAFISVISGLTLAGVALGVATLIVVMSVMNGFRTELISKILGLNGDFTAYPIERQFTDYDQTVKGIRTVTGVTHAVAFVEGQALASGAVASTGADVRGMDLASIKQLPLLYNSAKQGGWNGWDQGHGLAIGYRLAQKLGVGIGDSVTIITPKGIETPFGTTPNIHSYPVTVIFNVGMVDFDSFYVYMPLQAAQDYFGLYKDVLKPGAKDPGPLATDAEIDAAYERQYQATAVDIFIKDPDATEAMRASIQAGAGRPMILTSWQERNETFFSALQVERVVMFTILSMIVAVAAFNIISSLVMLVKDKGADIAVLRTMGATRSSIMRVFCMTGFAIGVVGTLVGFVLGIAIAANAETLRAFISNLVGVRIFPPEVFFLSALPSQIDPAEVTAIVLVALLLSFLATLYPAWRATKYDPVEALRYE
jgi:lipoprotein-releasing system permease protein